MREISLEVVEADGRHSAPFTGAKVFNRSGPDTLPVHAITPAIATMADSEPDEGASESDRWRSAFVPRVQSWANGNGVIALLASLEANYPHTFGLVAPEKRIDSTQTVCFVGNLPYDATPEDLAE